MPDEERTELNEQQLFDLLSDITKGGLLRLLTHIPEEEDTYTTVKQLKRDPTVDLKPGTIDRYYRELEELGLVAVRDAHPSNRVSLTKAGQDARELLTPDLNVRHPLQTQLSGTLPHPPQSPTRIVCERGATAPDPENRSFERALAANEGTLSPHRPRQQGIFSPHRPRQLPLSKSWLDGQAQFDRLAAGHQADGVTLVDAKIERLDEGRETFFGERGGEVHVITQWGGGLPTLVRIAVTLLSDSAFDTVLTRDRVEEVLAAPMGKEVLQLGRQMGWLDGTTYAGFKQTYQRVADELLTSLGSRDDSDVWMRTARNAHGLLASTTALYDALGFDLNVQVRIPDTAQLLRDESRTQNLVNFLKATVPKQAAYRGNSASRHLLETDGDKLGYRLPVDIDPLDRAASLTASWAIVGPEVSALRDELVAAFDSIDVRQQVADGTELGIEIPIEVATTNTPHAVERAIESTLSRTDRDLCEGLSVSALVRLYTSALAHPGDSRIEEARFPSPFDVADALLLADRLDSVNQGISEREVLRGLGWVRPESIYPWLAPSARKMMSALFQSGRPMQRADILDQSGVSKSSYSRHRSTLESLGLLVGTDDHEYSSTKPGEWASACVEDVVSTVDYSLQQRRLANWLDDLEQVLALRRESPRNIVRLG